MAAASKGGVQLPGNICQRQTSDLAFAPAINDADAAADDAMADGIDLQRTSFGYSSGGGTSCLSCLSCMSCRRHL